MRFIYEGFNFHSFDGFLFRTLAGVCLCLRAIALRWFMDIESLVMLVICVLMMVYLMYALLKPEKF